MNSLLTSAVLTLSSTLAQASYTQSPLQTLPEASNTPWVTHSDTDTVVVYRSPQEVCHDQWREIAGILAQHLVRYQTLALVNNFSQAKVTLKPMDEKLNNDSQKLTQRFRVKVYFTLNGAEHRYDPHQWLTFSWITNKIQSVELTFDKWFWVFGGKITCAQ